MKNRIIIITLYILVWVIAGDSFNPFDWKEEVQWVFAFCSVIGVAMYSLEKSNKEKK